MAKKKKSRKELLKGPDEFVTFSSRAADFISTHLNQLKYLGYAVVAIAVGYFAIQIWMGQVNEKGQTAYNTAADDMRNWMMKPDPDIADMKKSGELFSEVLEKHSMSNAARLALPLAAHVKFLEKDYSEAVKQYRNFLDEFSGDALYESLARLALASCYEAEGELKTAIETLNPLVEDSSGSTFRQTAMWNLARLYRLDNSPEKEEQILKDFVEEYEGSPYYAMAKARL
ncbi:MAG: tetratricopeptide repeat protein [Deltaproteobacteria bacterium]|nr:tetratricopeptide repeat protein [Deltaproteobacteria bacterium]